MKNLIITVNRRAYHDYSIEKVFTAGLVLTGTEVKSLRLSQVNLRESYAYHEKSEVWLYNAHIAKYQPGGIDNHDTTRPRKLLLTRTEINELIGKSSQKGFTIVPLRIFISGHLAKIEIGLGKGKKLYEKKQSLIEKQIDRETRQTLKRINR